MEYFIAWSGFIGAWALVAGPVYQASQELKDERVDRDLMAKLAVDVPRSAPISAWWWLLPPVAYVKRKRADDAYHEAVFRVIPEAEIRKLITFFNMATGWLIVAAGAFLIALKETWELLEVQHWPLWAFPLGVVAMLALTLGFTVVQQKRAESMLTRAGRA